MSGKVSLELPPNAGRLRRMFFSVVLESVEVFVALLALIAGTPILVDVTSLAPTSMLRQMPLWLVYYWAGGMVAGGVLTLIGILLYSYRIERMGIILLAVTALNYALALMAFLPMSWLSFITNIALGLAMLARYWVLGKLLRIIREVSANGP